MEELKEVLKELTQTPGVAGYEGKVAARMASLMGGLGAQVKEDNLGNVIALKKGRQGDKALKVMVAAHMDEIGFFVSGLEKGFLRVAAVGSFDFRTLVNQEVTVHGREDLPAIFSAPSPHLTEKEERSKGMTLDKLFVDTGLSENKLKQLVRVGDPVSVKGDFRELCGSRVAGKAMDDRAGLAVLYQGLKELEKMHHGPDVYAVATVQEEVGYRGALVSSYGITPDVGIAVDVTHGEMPGVPGHDAFALGKGPTIGWGPNIHPAVFKRMEKTAADYGIPAHKEIIPGGSGTDAMAMQIAGEGAATGILSIPLRYMHTSVETLDMRDIKNAALLLAFFIRDLEASFKEVLTCY